MRRPVRALRAFFGSEEGPTAVEYAVMVALLLVVALAAISALRARRQIIERAADEATRAPEELGNGLLFFPETQIVSPEAWVRGYLAAHPELQQTGEMRTGTLVRVKRTDQKPEAAK